jgi:hypothetical protein
MSENESDSDIALPEGELPVAPNPAFTLAPSRLSGSPRCLNCDIELEGPFCHFCGQPDRNFMRFFPVLLREFLEDFLDLDSRFARTLKPLLFHPGRLTRDYLDGRRFRYTPPMRLYLFSSIAFFLLAALLSANAIDPDNINFNSGSNVAIVADSEEEMQRVEEALEQLPPGIREQVELSMAEDAGDEENLFEDGELQFNDEPWDRETNPLIIPFMPDRLNNWINDEIDRSPQKGEMIKENPNLFVDQVFEILPATVFVLLPVVALIFKFWYLFARRFYIEHLMLALHNHAFIFTCLILMLLLEVIEDWLGTRGYGYAKQAAAWLNIGFGVWIPLYLLVSLRTVYQQNWFLTLGKYVVIGLSYLTLLGLVTSFVAVLSFLLL